MTTQHLEPDLRRDEGNKLEAYPDPLTGGHPWTIGVGHAGVEPDTVWTQETVDETLTQDIAGFCADLDANLPWWREQLDHVRQDVLANMCFNMGIGGLLEFEKTLAALQAQDWATAAVEMLDSDWATQVGNRANRLSEQIRTGVHQD